MGMYDSMTVNRYLCLRNGDGKVLYGLPRRASLNLDYDSLDRRLACGMRMMRHCGLI